MHSREKRGGHEPAASGGAALDDVAATAMKATLPNPPHPLEAGSSFEAGRLLLPTADAARLLGILPQSLRKWRVQGHGPRYIRLGGPAGRVAYRRSDIEAWLDARTFANTSEETVARK